MANGETKYMREAKFRSGEEKLTVYAHQGKTGFNVGVSHRKPGEKAVTGMQATFEKQEDAQKRFDELVKATTDAGWTPRQTGGGPRKVAFTAIPTAPTAQTGPVETAPAPKEERRAAKRS